MANHFFALAQWLGACALTIRFHRSTRKSKCESKWHAAICWQLIGRTTRVHSNAPPPSTHTHTHTLYINATTPVGNGHCKFTLACPSRAADLCQTSMLLACNCHVIRVSGCPFARRPLALWFLLSNAAAAQNLSITNSYFSYDSSFVIAFFFLFLCITHSNCVGL